MLEKKVFKAFTLMGSISFKAFATRTVEVAHKKDVITERVSPSMIITFLQSIWIVLA